jgi:hypothetical protein
MACSLNDENTFNRVETGMQAFFYEVKPISQNTGKKQGPRQGALASRYRGLKAGGLVQLHMYWQSAGGAA